MNTSRITPGIQIAFLYVAAVLWDGFFAVVFKSGRDFFDRRSLILLLLYLIVPVLYSYVLFRIVGEHSFIKKHPVLFGGAVVVGVAPILFLCLFWVSIFFAA